MEEKPPKQPSEDKPKRLGTIKIEEDGSNRLGGLNHNPKCSAGQSDAPAEASSSRPAPASGGRGGRKFKPKVPARRKAAQPTDAAGAGGNVEAENEAWKELMQAATSEASWQRGTGGRGRGRGDASKQRFQTTFGGSASQSNFAQGSSYVSGGGRGGGGGAGGASKGAAGKRITTQREIELQEAEASRAQEPEILLDYNQYYPTLLPLRQPGLEETDTEVHARDDRPPDLSIPKQHVRRKTQGLLTVDQKRKVWCFTEVQEAPGNTAEELDLLQSDPDTERLLLFQLPSLLPVHAPNPAAIAAHKQRQQPAAALNQLPSGKVGKLLVFESGAVKLQMGDVLLDVAAGTPCQFRQDVASINDKEGHFVFLGDVGQRVVCSPNIEQLISGDPIPDWSRAPQANEPDVKGKGKSNESLEIKQEAEDMDVDKQIKSEEDTMKQIGSPSRNKLLVSEDD